MARIEGTQLPDSLANSFCVNLEFFLTRDS